MAQEQSNIFALLIGINFYFPNKLPGGGTYGHLNGCVRDIDRMESFLKSQLGLPDDNIIRLMASHGGDKSRPAEDPEHWPTYENIVGGFQTILNKAQPGDQVIIHYAGHGGRAKTVFPPEVKTSPYDEALVPTDIGEDGRYLRDLELAHLLYQMTEKGLLVTALLDCCHSGGLTRGDAVPRGIAETDETERPAETLVADSLETLIHTWRQLSCSSRGGTFTAGDYLLSMIGWC